MLAPLLTRFQALHPGVRVRVLISERNQDPLLEGIDLIFRVDPVQPPTEGTTVLLTYRHQLLASPAYLARRKPPKHPRDLLEHSLLAFARGKRRFSWTFVRQKGLREEEMLVFEPVLAMNDYAGLASALLAGAGIGDLPPLVRPRLLAQGKLVEVMPGWHFRTFELTLVQTSNRFVSRPVRLFTELAAQLAPRLFPGLPV